MPSAPQLCTARSTTRPTASATKTLDTEENADWRLLYGGRTRSSMALLDRLAPYGDRVSVRPQDEHGLLDLAAFIAPPREGLTCRCG